MGYAVQKTLALGWIEAAQARDGNKVDIAAVPGAPAQLAEVHLKALYDPENKRTRE
jgi:glycine cleavage system aminomethyltransferase T